MSDAHAPPEPEDSLTAFLLAYDAALALGVTPPDPTSDAEVVARLASARDCLDRLHQLWPWPGAAPSDEGGLADLNLKLGRYVVRGVIGRGGHGVVFRAFDPDLNRQVALKMPRPEALASPELRRRAAREARAVARLDHPGIVPIHDVGESGPALFIATTLVEGPNLGAWLAERGEPVDQRQTVSIALALAEALAHAHARGVVHRDVKPGNILIETTRDEEGGTSIVPRIVDFGVARIVDEAGDETRTVAPALGTPRYMAPEQFLGPRDRVGPRADIYGLGAVLHTMLRGGPPDGPGIEGYGLVKAGIPEGLATIVAACLRADPDDRYPDAAALAADLRRFSLGEPVIAPNDRRPTRRAMLAGVGFGLGAVAAGSAFDAWKIRPSRASDGVPIHYARHVLRHEKGDVYQSRFSRDGKTLASAGLDGYVRFWDVESGEPLASIDHGSEVSSLDWSPDDRWVASVSDDGRLHLWDVATLRPVVPPRRAHGGEALSVRFSPDGRRLYTGGRDQRVARWPTLAPTPDAERGMPDIIECLEVARDGSHLIVGATIVGELHALTADLEVKRIWQLPLSVNARLRKIHGVDILPDAFYSGAALAVGSSDHVYLCFPDGMAMMFPSGVESDLFSVVAHPFRLVAFAAGGGDPSIHLFSLEGRERPPTAFLGHTNRVWGLAVSPDGRTLASSSRDGTLRLWRVPEPPGLAERRAERSM